MGPTPTALAAVLAALLALAGCAGRQAPSGGAPAPAAPTAPTARHGPPPEPGRVVATGVVEAGVEPGCLLLRDDRGARYLLLGGDRSALRPGARVRVSGDRLRTATTCQQGEALRVVRVRPAGSPR